MAAAPVTLPPSPPSPIRPRFGRLSDRALIWMFVTPTMVLLLAIAIFPLLWSLYLAFTKFSVINDAKTGPLWIGTKNFERLLNDPEVWQRFSVTAGFVIPAVFIELLLGFGLAMLLNR
jgi:multiple sugar transport system permease protein